MESAHNVGFAERPTLIIGLMSGTSLDGLDLCAVKVEKRTNGRWNYAIVANETHVYPKEWQSQLASAFAKTRNELQELHLEYGAYLGKQVRIFCDKHNISPQLIASHGHTIHHRPEEGYTFQLGDGKVLADICGCATVSDFRTLDVSLRGQGAPLVPLIDRVVFREYAQCINLGGFANVSYERKGARLAFDITCVNALLNKLTLRLSLSYDDEGKIARSGQVDNTLLNELNGLPFYKIDGPKSLGREWLETEVWPLIETHSKRLSTPDLLATSTQHIAQIISTALAELPEGKILVTGGGAFNCYLIELIRSVLPATHKLVLPEGELIEFKEALAFAILGALRVRGEVNTLKSVTGASRDSSGGTYFIPNSSN